MNKTELFCCIKDQCHEDCCGEYVGFSDRLNSVERREFMEIILTDEDVISLKKNNFSELMYCGEDGLFRLFTDADGTCIAHRSGKCIINNCKPTICRCFPLYMDVFIGICSHKDCPAVNSKYTLSNYKKEIEPLLKMCEFWISYYKKQI